MSNRQIKADSLVLQRGHFKLGPLDFEVQSGKLFALIGKNGSGKTSLLRCLNRRLKSHSGQLSFGNQIQSSCTVGVEPLFFDHWSIRKNFEWLGRLGRLNLRKPELLNHIQHFYDQPIFELSSGKRRQTELIFALAHHFDMLLLDEAFAHLDPSQRQFFKTEINAVVAEDKIVVMSGHDLQDFSEMPVAVDLRLA